ncbi:MAG: hypothetical protein EOP08_11055 [Proteobacteria bacterium]|nr:MAG: hypothetical protein EOP08_11055 [Pseudomonadota bacterium]
MLQAHAGRARSSRRVGGVAMLLSGAGLVGGGLLADLEYDQTYGQVLWIGGAAVGAAGLLSLFKSSPIESLADESGTMSAGSIRANWASMASTARSTRKVSGVVSMALGGAAVVAGSLFAGGVGNLDREDQRDWTVAFFVLSGSLIGGGLSSLLVESERDGLSQRLRNRGLETVRTLVRCVAHARRRRRGRLRRVVSTRERVGSWPPSGRCCARGR